MERGDFDEEDQEVLELVPAALDSLASSVQTDLAHAAIGVIDFPDVHFGQHHTRDVLAGDLQPDGGAFDGILDVLSWKSGRRRKAYWNSPAAY